MTPDSRWKTTDMGSSGSSSEYPCRPSSPSNSANTYYNLRAAPDYCAYVVAVADGKQDPPVAEDKIQFPIYDTAQSYRQNEKRMASFSEEHRQWVREIQPFMGDKSPDHYLLHWLNDLARRDRHRQLHVLGAYVSEVAPEVRAPEGAAVLFEEVAPVTFVEGDVVVARFVVAPFASGDEVETIPIWPSTLKWGKYARASRRCQVAVVPNEQASLGSQFLRRRRDRTVRTRLSRLDALEVRRGGRGYRRAI